MTVSVAWDAPDPLPGPLVVRTVEVSDPGPLAARLPRGPVAAWLRRGEGMVAWGRTARVRPGGGADRFDAATRSLAALADRAEVHDPLEVPGSGLVAFGSFTFDPADAGSVLEVPAAVLGRRGGRAWFTTIGAHPAAPPAPLVDAPRPPGPLRWSPGARTAEQWRGAVAAAVARIRSGGLDKVVMARDLLARADAPIDERALLDRLARRHPDCYTFAVDGLVGATPELLVRRSGRSVEALVLAGTSPRGAGPSEDRALAERLAASAKDAEEHRYAVESVRTALAPLCADLDIADRPRLLRLANVQHLATPVHGTLAADRTALSVAAALHPTAAVCGTPTPAALEAIRELEGMGRGRYAGPVGWVDQRGDGEWGIALRCAHIDGPTARLFAGCGIVADSDPAAELAEADNKFRVMADALTG
ncbi:isochorismate synthase [Allonocardiopsis opalescens]|uniref:isochorismate synthase n=1 Tax=Allonocardiopsis opalescens TaxID=1144618 RepID=A0A2T0Q4S1_9ACTN|nr:isochorismate synthase [Allonocardiopsis opalescens]PRX98780.1 isochorismate synthase [Allonocardiopsis opalescens]